MTFVNSILSYTISVLITIIFASYREFTKSVNIFRASNITIISTRSRNFLSLIWRITGSKGGIIFKKYFQITICTFILMTSEIPCLAQTFSSFNSISNKTFTMVIINFTSFWNITSIYSRSCTFRAIIRLYIDYWA